MADVWDNVASGLLSEVHVLLSALRETDFFKGMGSEIERAFAASLIGGGHIAGYPIFQGMPDRQIGDMYFLAPQVPVGDYRVDFVLGHTRNYDKPHLCIVVECDGHAFHERTKEQAARDKARDRFLSTRYGKVIRFTGSEIYRDPSRCASEAATVLLAADREE